MRWRKPSARLPQSTSGQVTLAGVAVCLLGIGIAALAGWTKEQEMPEEQKRKAIKEFNFTKGILVATFSGIMSACFSYALTWGKPMNEASALAGTPTFWIGLPRLCVVLAGGFTTNFIWCALLNRQEPAPAINISLRMSTAGTRASRRIGQRGTRARRRSGRRLRI